MYKIDRRSAQFLFLNLGHLYDHFFMLIFTTAVITIQTEPGFEGSYGFLLMLSTASFVLFGAAAPIAGWLGDKWSKHAMMSVFFIGIGLASIATSLATGPWTLAAGLMVIGLFGAIYHPVGIAMVAENARQLGKELGINGVFGNIGVALAALVTGFIADQYGWRTAFIVPGIISVFTGVAYAFFVKTAPEGALVSKTDKFIGASRSEIKRVLIIVAVATMFGTLVFNATTVTLPKVLEERLGDLASSGAEVGMWAFAVFMIGAVAQILVGHLLDRYPLKPVYVTVVALQIPVLFMVAYAAGPEMLGLSSLMMFLIFGTIPINDTIIARYVSKEWRSRVYAIKYCLGLSVAGAAPLLMGANYDVFGGFTTSFLILTLCASVVTAAALFMPSRKGPNEAQPQPAE